MNAVRLDLANEYERVLFLKVEAEQQADVDAVPSFIVLRGHTLLACIAGAEAPAVQTHSHKPGFTPQSTTGQAPPPLSHADDKSPEELEQRLRKLMGQDNIVIFMKGLLDAPRCGSFRRAVALLRDKHAVFASYDILSDDSGRKGLNAQQCAYVAKFVDDGKFVGGLDVATEMVENDEWAEVAGEKA
ncbi:hypothetical protein PUNSTDRAFT_134278 [Punctularia strigosozonata HHB-11173 SS5]|uniref:uncharacterized protein n=1 Tax=Punctularia strigosozonata (strain HHB-11173) TaxID=741275 RepID=UPI0004416E53|nr:uncharacterized protein PUNSTDRAFT_134278 [Punctularia strigosozonata HHB-11173 SS5]EIN09111.1 hypothetical protein PUNSTDRAFT_134278 [Punctularia strigosozonata HHB-11173 SS5]